MNTGSRLAWSDAISGGVRGAGAGDLAEVAAGAELCRCRADLRGAQGGVCARAHHWQFHQFLVPTRNAFPPLARISYFHILFHVDMLHQNLQIHW